MHNHTAQNADCERKFKKEVSEPKKSVPALLFYSAVIDSAATE